MLFKASEYNNNIEKTGNEEIYMADSIQQAVEKLLYCRRLTDGNSWVGPCGQVVHTRKFSWVITKEKA